MIQIIAYTILNAKEKPRNHARLNLEATPGFEPGIRVLQTRALPLGYVATMPDNWSGIAVVLARVAGFEPANDGIRIRCLTAWLYPISSVIVAHSVLCIKENFGVDGGIRTHEYWSHNPGS